MFKKALMIVALAFVAGQENVAVAAPYYTKRAPVVRGAQYREHRRIRQGERTGAITPEESASLRSEQAGIRDERASARADGVYTRPERRSIRRDQREASSNIYSAKHN